MSETIDRLNAALEGRYRIERALGEGGMATVYVAEDARHERRVALKVLKPELAAVVGAERFLAEIRTTANLQHPHILPLFDSGEADGFLFYVMPYVEGETLRDRLDRERQLPVEEAVRIASAVADALHAAHEQGVVHRDVKPANVLLSRGQPLVADFGIALAVSQGGGGRLTETGLSLGTPYYMSPEQATGEVHLGPRADVYALGCVLYEMLVGEPPFTGSTPQAILGKIVTGAAKPPSAERASVPAHVDAAIARALERVPADRFATASRFAEALADTGFRHPSGQAARSAAAGGPWKAVAAALALALVLTAGALLWSSTATDGPPPLDRFVVTVPDGVSVAGGFRGLAVAPDGRTVVFADQAGRLYRRALDQPDAIPIPNVGTPAWYPFFSPDGEWVAYFDQSAQTLRKVRLDGTLDQTLASTPGTGRSGGWADDAIVYTWIEDGEGRGVWRVPDSGGDPVRIEGSDTLGLAWISVTTDGRTVLGQADDQVVALTIESGESKSLFPGLTPRYLPGGHIAYFRDDALWTVPFDQERVEVTGEHVLVEQEVRRESNELATFAVGGDLLFYRQAAPTTYLPVWRRGDGTGDVVDPTLIGSIIASPAISPDGRFVAFEREDGGPRDIWVYSFEEATSWRFTLSGRNQYPFWSPDGTEIGFTSARDGLQPALYARPVDMSADARLIRSDPEAALYEGTWAPDGRIFYRRGFLSVSGSEELYVIEPGSDDPVLFVGEGTRARNPAPSPDGRWIAYTSYDSGDPEVVVREIDGSGPPRQVSTDTGTVPLWSPDGGTIFYVAGVAPFPLIAATVRTEPTFAVVARTELYEWGNPAFVHSSLHPQWDVSPADGRILAIGPSRSAEGRYIAVQGFLSGLAPRGR